MNRKAANARFAAAVQWREPAMTDDENSGDAGVTNTTNEEPRRAVNRAAPISYPGRKTEEKRGR
ncbi:hypothetical protein AB4Y44_22325 [Paraburkholderia sp. BR10937]|uniref:hypothetical protein n=1 Tax=Paraburkholderia sp. BR10937 TaxID=3236994 RepID=UPI0034D38A0F